MSPPPWTLSGSGLLAMYAPAPGRPVGALMLVRYATSPVGPYDELLWVALTRTLFGWRPQVAHIWVSTAESAVWGRHNWGLPKRLAHFAWEQGQVRVTGEDGREVAHLAFRMGGPRLPVTSALIPAPLRTLAQPNLEGGEGWLLTPVGAAGHVTPARLTVLQADGLRPPLRQIRPRLTLGVPDFRLVFPVPRQA
ncbi:acetoacetate decarboxylase family protein [Deinococcus apachensis]|uniref:acetoacetate decarboxylase family protein n=1 Tax=Deinococcus apachensis TaxID=309886 RepID=UPI00068822ED|nr:acetoacetate decarboxylase family protein [Deinococcus apachensis]